MNLRSKQLLTLFVVLLTFLFSTQAYATQFFNDPLFPNQWWLRADISYSTRAINAWSRTMGNRDVIIAIIDTGIDYQHADLADNIWVNSKEISADGIDNDGNGFIDDIQGWNVIDGNASPRDEIHHGTNMAGIIAAGVNNVEGIIGIAPNVRIMNVKGLAGTRGRGTSADIVNAIHYAAANGARIINMSFIFERLFNTSLYYAIAQHPDILFVAAAGNQSLNNDIIPSTPASFTINWTINGKHYSALPHVITVGAVCDGTLADFSNYGVRSVCIVAPATNILSTRMRVHTETGWQSAYHILGRGTSSSAAIVSGAAALLLSERPTLTPEDLIALLKNNVTPLPTLTDRVNSGGTLNIEAAMASIPLGDGYRVRADTLNIFSSLPMSTAIPPQWRDTSAHWAADEIKALGTMGIFQGFTDRTFRPGVVVTEDQFFILLTRMALLSDGPQTLFMPNQRLTRGKTAEILTMFFDTTSASDSAAHSTTITDVIGSVGGAIHIIREYGLMSNFPDGTFRADAHLTRAEAAVILYRLLTVFGNRSTS